MPTFANKARFDDVVCIRETASAILCDINGKTQWIPQSVVDDDSEVYEDGHEGELVIAQWFAEKEGLV